MELSKDEVKLIIQIINEYSDVLEMEFSSCLPKEDKQLLEKLAVWFNEQP